MDNKENKKNSIVAGQGDEEKVKGSCIIFRKGEVLSLKVIEDDLKRREEKEKFELRDCFRETEGGQGNEES